MPDRLPPLIAGTKTLATPPKWVFAEDQLTFAAALDIDGVTQIGLRLRGVCKRDFPYRNVTFQIEYLFRDRPKPAPVVRVDWRPMNPHTNKNIGPAEWRLAQFHCSHIHPFQENYDWMIGNGLPLAENLRANLPIATPLEHDPNDVTGLVTLVGQCFNIDGVAAIPAPPWTAPRLL